MVQHFGLFIIFFLLGRAYAQDERYYRQILNGDLPQVSQEIKEVAEHQFNVLGKPYAIDINSDGFEEYIQPQKRDGVDWIEIKNASGQKLFESKLLAMGSESSLYKIKLVSISPTTKVLILFLDEGQTIGKKFESTARIYLVSMDKNDLSTLKITQGPHHFHEKEGQREQYWRKDYAVEVRDINNDGVRDIVVNFNHIQRIMIYKDRGEWERL